MSTIARIVAAALLVLGSAVSLAACPDAGAVAAYVADFVAPRPVKGYGKDFSLADAECARDKLLRALPPVLGGLVGYKAGLTNPDSQKRFGMSEPVWGAMFANDMQASGVRVPAAFGARSRYEADFIVVVKDAGLAEAKTPREALDHLSHIMPFIELPDLMIEGAMNGPQLVAANVAFRAGIKGTPIPVQPTQAFADSLAAMTVVMTEDKSGRELARAKGSAIMEHPLHAAIWLAQALKKHGIQLQPGDLLSLGGYAASAPTKAGETITVRYLGLPGDPAVTVHFQ